MFGWHKSPMAVKSGPNGDPPERSLPTPDEKSPNSTMLPLISKRPVINSTLLAVLVALYLLGVANLTFWKEAWIGFANPVGFVAFAIATLAIFIGVMVGLSFKYVAKPLYIFAILSSSAASYFTDTFGTIINANMIENVLQTNSGEGGEFFTVNLLLHVLGFGILPCLLIAWVRVDYGGLASRLRFNVAVLAAMGVIAGALIGAQLSDVKAAVRRDFHVMTGALNPAGPVSSVIKVAVAAFRNRNAVRAPFGDDAKKGAWLAVKRKPVVAVIVAGESARAMNFSLNGYARNTNPELARRDVLNFSNVTSCGAETSISLPCMFSGYLRTEFSKDKALRRESLMDVFKHAGYDVNWWDNDSGSKGVADGVNYVSYMVKPDPDLCLSGTCQDDMFLGDLANLVVSAKQDTVVVLHQRGSHGPAYYLRYPDTFGPFKPDCRLYQPTDCSSEEIVNAYDNTIAYTDRFLARVIDLLTKHQDRVDGTMFYVSDHGESLGENGLYMHGAEYAIAPREQTHIPLIVWFSSDFAKLSGFDFACARARSAMPYSHDNVFDTLLGMLNVETRIYRAGLDIFSGCRAAEPRS
ncbi:phosphoethanolamine--lipid A transferase [Rhizobium sp. KVB221]|uniref:Phosphoethanolamine--lipid A transferase n=1 Tax=Rhizobium setariae TaxID=2801340 RepID=A0A936YTD9_9HYPH|nr:phosphoethanolamine--lipid A transferase [Rhizobium setariae]MBL0375513.1 phosphoethanolamine--lipid A transferase [Rhizobium setariae]